MTIHNPSSSRFFNVDLPTELPERFWAKVEYEAMSGCWLWSGGTDTSGYGVLRLGKAMRKAHRLSYTHAFGQIPHGLIICHRCDTPRCINPDHLWAGTDADNSADRGAKGRHRYAVGTDHPLAKLDDLAVAAIRAMHAARVKTRVIAKVFEVSESSVQKIASGRKWRHVA